MRHLEVAICQIILNKNKFRVLEKKYLGNYDRAIIGDWAAWTWEQDKEVFFRKLLSEKKVISFLLFLLLV